MNSILTPKEQKILNHKIEAQGWESIEEFFQQLSTHQGIKNDECFKAINQLLEKDAQYVQNLKIEERRENCDLFTNEIERYDKLKFISNKLNNSNVLKDVDNLRVVNKTNQEWDAVDGPFTDFIPAALSPVTNNTCY